MNDLAQQTDCTRAMSPDQEADVAYAGRDDVDLSGTRTGPYLLEAQIGRGGGGTVYRALHEDGERYALKVLLPQPGAGMETFLRFSREIQTLQELEHPNIVRVFESGTIANNLPYFAMELLEGVTLRELLDRHRRLSPEECLEVIQPICSALSEAHAVGIVHRDLKASNVFVCGEPAVIKLLDFGVAKFIQPDADALNLTTYGTQIGTLDSMAPEQIRCEQVDARTDVYAMGVLLYLMLTGHLPFHGVTPEELMQAHLYEPPPRPSWVVPLPNAVDEVVLKCLQKQRSHRFESMAAALHAFLHAVEGTSPLSEPQAHPQPRLAVYVELIERDDTETTDEDLDDAILTALDDASTLLEDLGFSIALELGNSLVAIDLRADVPYLTAIPEHLKGFAEGVDASLRVKVVVHAATAQCDQGQLVGGDLANLETWATEKRGPGLVITPEGERFIAHESQTRHCDVG